MISTKINDDGAADHERENINFTEIKEKSFEEAQIKLNKFISFLC